MMDQHTPGKVHWEIREAVYPDGYIDELVQEGGRVILRHESIRPMLLQDRRRIAACWNACEEAGLSTAALEAGVVREMVDEIKRLQQKVQRANALAVAVEQVLKAWSMGDYLTPFMDDLRNALFDFEGPVASEDGWLEVATDGEEGGATHA